jgi:hypothetical protein
MIKNILLGTLLLAFVLQSCTKRYDEINTNPNLETVVSPEQLFAPALVNILSINMSRNYSFNNELMQVTVNMGDGDGKVFRYDIRTTWGTQPWNNLYLQLTNLKNIYSIADTSSRYKNDSYKGVSIILQSWVYSILTDTYGDIPYSESNLGRLEDGANRRPKFDKQKDIYMAIYDSLEVANSILAQSTDTINSNSDPVFKGDIAKWRKFGNALYLRLLLRLSGKSEVAATVISKFQNIVNNPVQYPVISSNSESAILRWSGSAIAAEPLSSPFNSMRVQDFRSPGLGEFFIGNLRNWNSPLIQTSAPHGTNSINRLGIAQGSNAWSGIPSGYSPGQDVSKSSYFFSSDQNTTNQVTTPRINMQTEPLTGQMLNYAEVQFMLAEAALKGWITGGDSLYYNKGVLGYMQMWLPTSFTAAALTSGGVTGGGFLGDADISYLPYLSFDEKMDLIHLQKYYALLWCDMQQWIEYRRTGHPVLPKGPGLIPPGIMPARLNYPVEVQSTNPTYYKEAVASQGPDNINTQVWWQKP